MIELSQRLIGYLLMEIWMDNILDINSHIYSEGVSDHCLILIKMVQVEKIHMATFKNCNV